MNLDDMSLKMKIKLALLGGLVIFALFLFMSGNAMPDSTDLFRLKRLQEKVFMKIKMNPRKKVEYYNFLLNERLGELEYLVENRQFTYLRTSSLRYSTTAGEMTELVIKNNLNEVIPHTKNVFNKHQDVFNQLVELYHPVKDSEEWKYLQDDYNYLDIYLGFLSRQ